MKISLAIITTATIMVLGILSCIKEPIGPISGSGSETIMGKIVNINNIPAKNTHVYLCSDSLEDNIEILDSTTTNDTGGYVFDSIISGKYRIKANDETQTLILLTPTITYNDISKPFLRGVDTLHSPGEITGRLVYGTKPITGALCYLRQTPYFEYTDSTGFLLSKIPKGTYTLRIVPPKPYALIDTLVNIQPGTLLNLGDISLGADPQEFPPGVDSLQATYDTTTGIVNLIWSNATVSDLDGYVIYRSIDSSIFSALPLIIHANSYSDSVIEKGIAEGATLRYFIKAIDLSGSQSTQSSPTKVVIAASPTLVKTAIKFSRTDTLHNSDSLHIIASFSNPTRKNSTLEWYLDSTTMPIVKKFISQSNGSDTLIVHIPDTLRHRIYVKITDTAGKIWIDSTTVKGTAVPIAPGVWRKLSDAPCGGQTKICGIWNNKIYVVSKSMPPVASVYGIYSFDPQTGVWVHCSNLPTNRKGTGATIRHDTIYVAGGVTLSTLTNTIEKYSLNNNTWSTHTPLPQPSQEFGIISLNETIFIFGGASSDPLYPKALSLMSVLDSVNKSIPTPAMNASGRYSFGITTIGDTVYALGGTWGSNAILSSVERHALKDNTQWQQLESLSIPRKAFGAASINKNIFAVGGINNDSIIATTEIYSTVTEHWQNGAILNIPRSDLGVVACNGQIYAIGGIDKNGNSVSTVEVYLP